MNYQTLPQLPMMLKLWCWYSLKFARPRWRIFTCYLQIVYKSALERTHFLIDLKQIAERRDTVIKISSFRSGWAAEIWRHKKFWICCTQTVGQSQKNNKGFSQAFKLVVILTIKHPANVDLPSTERVNRHLTSSM